MLYYKMAKTCVLVQVLWKAFVKMILDVHGLYGVDACEGKMEGVGNFEENDKTHIQV